MQKLIEEAKSGRARCRGCRKNIDKGELRYGEEAPNQFGDGTAMQWLHLLCAAKKHPREMSGHRTATVLQSMRDFDDEFGKKKTSTLYELSTYKVID